MVRLGSRPTKTKTFIKRLQSGVFAAVFAGAQLASVAAILLPSTASAAVTPATNPALSQACGLDIALVIDRSNSINETEMAQIKTAMTSFTNALNGTPTQFSVTEFGNSASVIRTFTSNITLVNNAINSVSTSGGGTNWEDGLLKAQGTFDPRADKPNLVIFASDGNPTYRIGGGNGSSDPLGYNLDAAATRANAIKAAGTRILALGIGNDLDTDNLKAISGPNANTGNVLTSDVITSGFATLAADLATFARQTCGGTITVQKLIDADGNINTTDDRTPANGWNFNVAGTSSTTSSNGQTDAVRVQPGTYSVSEATQNGYQILSASCSGASNNGTRQGVTVSGITVSNDNIVSCVFINTAVRGSIKVDKKLDADGNGTYESGNSEANALGFRWLRDGANSNTFGTTTSNVLTGNYAISENTIAGYHATGWYYTDNQQQSCANPAGITLPANVAINANQTTSVTICNARDNGKIVIKKQVVNNNGGSAKASDFTLHIKQGATSVTGSPAAGSTTGTEYTLPTGTYTVSEDSYFGYEQTSLICADQRTGATVAHPVVLANGQYIVCTVVNDDKAPSVTIIKEVINPYGSALPASAFQLYLNGNVVTSGQTYNTFDAGNYTVSEDQQSGYQFSGVSGDCAEGNNAINLLLQVGVNATCTLTNTAIQPKLIVKKIVINDNSGTKEDSDFTMVINGNSPTINNFPGTMYGQSVGLNEGAYSVSELGAEGYTATFSAGCAGTIKIGEAKTCVITNNDIANPGIRVEKYGPNTAHEGDVINYVFKVYNIGDTTLDNVYIDDDIATGETCDDTFLAVGASTTCYASYTIPTPQVENVVNTVVAYGTDPDDIIVDDTDDHTLDALHPSIDVAKSGPTAALAGEEVTYTFTVTNTGDVAINLYQINDDIAGEGIYVDGDVNGNGLLDLDETWTFTAKYVIPNTQVAPVVNTVTVCGYQYYLFEEVDKRLDRGGDILERVGITDGDIVLPPADEIACATDNHTTEVTAKIPGKGGQQPAPTDTLAVTGQTVGRIATIVLAASSMLLVAVALRSRYQVEEQ